MKTIYLHFGSQKTATTFIQNTLRLNRHILNDNNWDYPITSLEQNGIETYKKAWGNDLLLTPDTSNLALYPIGNSHYDFTIALEKDNKSKIARYMEHIENSPASNIILSSELFWTFPLTASSSGEILSSEEYLPQRRRFLEQLFSLFTKDKFQLKIIVYLRRQDLYFESLYREGITSPQFNHNPIEDTWRHFYPLYYGKMLDLISEYIAADDIIVRYFDKSIFKENNIFLDFCQSLNIPIAKSDIKYPNEAFYANPGLNHQACEFLLTQKNHAINGRSWNDLTYTLRNLYFNSASKESDKKYFISNATRESMLAHFKDENLHVAKKYMKQTTMPKFYTIESQDDAAPQELTAKQLAEIVGALFLESQHLARENEKIISSLSIRLSNITKKTNAFILDKHYSSKRFAQELNKETHVKLNELDEKYTKIEITVEQIRQNIHKLNETLNKLQAKLPIMEEQ